MIYSLNFFTSLQTLIGNNITVLQHSYTIIIHKTVILQLLYNNTNQTIGMSWELQRQEIYTV